MVRLDNSSAHADDFPFTVDHQRLDASLRLRLQRLRRTAKDGAALVNRRGAPHRQRRSFTVWRGCQC